jgi:dienelactone hydrolase
MLEVGGLAVRDTADKEETMKRKLLFGLLVALLVAGQALAAPPAPQYSEELVTGLTQGNHDLDCTVIRPWVTSVGPGSTLYPVIVWANGWNGGDVTGESTTAGYKPGLIKWALDGPYIVIAANQWSPQESDVLACLQWLVDQNETEGSEYEGVVDTGAIGLAGHSQGGGAVIKAGDGEPNGFEIAAVLAMAPYGPSWVDPGSQDGPVMLIGGTDDQVVPVSWFLEVWEAIQVNGQGGLLAVLQGGNHNDDAWAPEGENPEETDFGRYQLVSELWWQSQLNGSTAAGCQLERVLGKDPWDTQWTDGSG